MKAVFILVALMVAGLCRAAETNAQFHNFWTQGKPGKVPAGLEVSLVADKTNFFLGENILLHYRIHNASSNTFKISVGGDYRGSTRADRFTVTAVSADGIPVADPTPFMRNMGGGLMPNSEIKPGEDWFENVWVIAYCRFDGPGSYTVHSFHDLGFGEPMAADPRETSCTIRLRAPTEAEAESILVEAETAKPYNGSTWGKKGEARLDYHCIRWPTFLEPLERRAERENTDALEGIASIRTLDATRALVRLLEHTNIAFAAKAAQQLEVRLPHPESDFTGPWGKERRQVIIEGAWDDLLGQPVQDFCARLLMWKERSGFLTATSLLRLVGTTNQIPALKRALAYGVVQTNAEYLSDIHYPSPIRVCDALAVTILGLDAKIADKLDPDVSPENLVLYLSQHGGADKTFSDTDVRCFHKAMRSDLPYLRMKSLESLSTGIPAALEDDITRCLSDNNLGVQNYAFLAAQRMENPAHRDLALAVLKSADDEWLRQNAQQLADKYGSRYESAMAWCAHLVAPKDINDYTLHHALAELLHMTTGRYSGGGGFYPSFTDKDAKALRKRWEEFLTENRNQINAGKIFTNQLTGVPSDLIPPGWTLNPL
ncbi:MAG: hypothetical protein ABSA47_02235 [Verrucomicrobiota bacterium]|jgi:hypothetical protein